jgi:hypothetical protein
MVAYSVWLIVIAWPLGALTPALAGSGDTTKRDVPTLRTTPYRYHPLRYKQKGRE